jgi:hypothetical protein
MAVRTSRRSDGKQKIIAFQFQSDAFQEIVISVFGIKLSIYVGLSNRFPDFLNLYLLSHLDGRDVQFLIFSLRRLAKTQAPSKKRDWEKRFLTHMFELLM